MGNASIKPLMAQVVALADGDAEKTAAVLAKLAAGLEKKNAKTSDMVLTRHAAGVRKLFSIATSSSSCAVAALEIVSSLANEENNARKLFTTYHADLVPGLILNLDSTGTDEAVQAESLVVFINMCDADDTQREITTKYPALVSKLFALAESASPVVAANALLVFQNLVMNTANKKEITPTLLPVLISKLTNTNSTDADEDTINAALDVLQNVSDDVHFKREMITNFPALFPALLTKLDSATNSEVVLTNALEVMSNLSGDNRNAREMATHGTAELVPTLMYMLQHEDSSEDVQVEVLDVLINLVGHAVTASEVLAVYSSVLLPFVVERMTSSPRFHVIALRLVYSLSCSAPNRPLLRDNKAVVDALVQQRHKKPTKKQQRDEDEAEDSAPFFALLTLVNLFGAMEDSPWLKTDEAMLESIYDLIDMAMQRNGWDLNDPLLAFRYLCVVESNRQILWRKYSAKFLTSVLGALKRAVDEDEDAHAAENAMSTLSQFSFEDEPLAWFQANKRAQLDPVLAKLDKHKDLFPEAHRAAQFFLLRVNPPKVKTEEEQAAAAASSSTARNTAAATGPVKPTIMISYNWGAQKQARAIHAILEQRGYPVWRDEDNMKADIMDAMAEAVSVSRVVLVLVSQAYKESTNCKMEAKFAHNNKRKLIPVLVEPGYQFAADGWLGLMLGSMLYYDVSRCGDDAGEMESCINNLVDKEVETLPPVVAKPAAAAAAPTAAPTTAPITPTPAPTTPTPKKKPAAPQNEAELRAWLGEEHGVIADKLVKEGLVLGRDLETLSGKSSVEVKYLLELNTKQVFDLERKLKEVFA